MKYYEIINFMRKHKDEPDLVKKLIEKNIDPKEALFSRYISKIEVFLREREKMIESLISYIEFMTNNEWKLVDRRVFIKKLDNPNEECRIPRDKHEFREIKTEDISKRCSFQQAIFSYCFEEKLEALGSLLASQEECIVFAANVGGLKDKEDKELVLKLANELKMLDSEGDKIINKQK